MQALFCSVLGLRVYVILEVLSNVLETIFGCYSLLIILCFWS